MSYAWFRRPWLNRTTRKNRSPLSTCGVCSNPVLLETAKTDEHGQAVHRECFLLRAKPEPATGQPAYRVVQLPGFLGHYKV
jgi:hypothetical protein